MKSKKLLQSRSDVKLTFVNQYLYFFSICLKTIPTNSTKISRKFKITLLIRCRFGFNLTDIGFTLIEMSLKQVFTSHIP